jgi:hypothetical protein
MGISHHSTSPIPPSGSSDDFVNKGIRRDDLLTEVFATESSFPNGEGVTNHKRQQAIRLPGNSFAHRR